jgi:membrane protein
VAFITIGWLLFTAGFNFYAQYMGTFNRTSGVLGVFASLMVRIYLFSLIILAGTEINSELGKMRAEKGAVLQAGTYLH